MSVVVADLLLTSIDELNELYDRGDVSPTEVARAHADQLNKTDPGLDAFMWFDEERFLQAARQAELRMVARNRLGPMDGVVVSVKDTEDIAGAPTTFGSRFLESNISERDGLITSRLKAAGALIIGKTTLPQFGYKDMGDNLLGKRCVNPWNRELTAGGSSAGAAASLAAGVGHVAHGNDGGGSVRIPAAFCGLFGLKPSFGRIPFEPAGDKFACRSHQGTLARSVRDAALLLTSLAGPDSVDPFAIDNEWTPVRVEGDLDVTGTRVAWFDRMPGYGIDPEIVEVCTTGVRVFEDLGCKVDRAHVTWGDAPRIFSALYQVAKAYEAENWYAQVPEYFEPTLAELIEAGLSTGWSDYFEAVRGRSHIYDAVDRMFEKFDFLLLPATQALPWSAEPGPNEGPGPIGGVGSGTLAERLAMTAPFNLTGHPAAVVPCGLSGDGMPVALQLVGPWHQDTAVLRLAAAFERAAPWSSWYATLAEGIN